MALVAAAVGCQRPAGNGDGVDGGGSSRLACGNGVIDGAEVCDDGNTEDGDGCSADCTSDETCGNGVVDAAEGELCDDGNASGGDACSADCKSDETCGNGVIDVDRGETCDDGNKIGGDGCSANCQSNEQCGNGVVDAGEACDSSNQATATCDPDCTAPVCGDGVLNSAAGEQCDDHNTNDNDSCTHLCKPSRCGDGIRNPNTEECDDGNNDNSDGCQNNCKLGPGNDFANNAIDISAGGTFDVDLTHAHDDVRSSCNDLNGRDVFYKLHLGTDEVIYFDTFGSTFDTTLALYDGSCTARQNEVVCEDDACNTGSSLVARWLGPGDYCLVLDQNSAATGQAGPATLTVRHAGRGGDWIPFGSGQVVTGDTRNDADTWQATCVNTAAAGDHAYWFVTCPGETVKVDADTCTDPQLDTALFVRSGLDQTDDQTCNDDQTDPGCNSLSSRISVVVSGPPDVHWLVVEGTHGAAGPYTLTYTIVEP